MNKEKLIDAIKGITDQSILDDIHRLLEMETDEKPFATSTDQREKIQIALSEVIRGNTIDSETADKEIDEWLNG